MSCGDKSNNRPVRRPGLAWVAAAMCAWVVLLPAAQVRAVQAKTWVHAAEGDFSSGKFDKSLVTSRGQVMLSRAVSDILKDREDVEYINAIAQAADGAIYAGTGPAGMVFKIEGDKAEVWFNTPAANILSLLVGRGNLLYAGAGGKKGQIHQITGKDKGVVVFEQEDVHYVWAMAEGPKGQIYAATGPKGQLFEVMPGAETKEIYKSKKEKNLLSLAIDPKGTLYAGSDKNGLVYRIDPNKGEVVVLYDANEAEISVILLDGDGNVYAATADASQARPQASAGRKEPVAGRPVSKPASNPGTTTRPTSGLGTRPAGSKASGRSATRPGKSSSGRRPSGRPTGGSGQPNGGGNAVYQIDPTGYVTEVFRKPVVVLCMAWDADKLLIGTGNEGRIYQVDIRNEVEACIAKLEPKQVLSLLRLEKGSIVAGTANAGQIHELAKGFAKEGTLIVKELDAKQLARWGRVRWRGSVAQDTSVTFATRSGNVSDAEDDTWSPWSAEIVGKPGESFQIPSPANKRFLQYRITLKSVDGKASSRVDRLVLSYVTANRPPKVSSFSVGMPKGGTADGPPRPPGGGRAKPIIPGLLPQDKQPLTWKAQDPNGDRLEYEVSYRAAAAGPWIAIKDKIKETKYTWDSKTVADGWYELKIRASDKPGNPPDLAEYDERISDPVLVDNTRPDVEEVKVAVENKVVRVSLTVRDAHSTIRHLSYAVDSNSDTDYSLVFPTDDIYDDRIEKFDFAIEDQKAGPHQLTIRVADVNANIRFAPIQFVIPE